MTADTSQARASLDPDLLGRDGTGAGSLEASLRPFGESTMLPAAAYTSAEVFAWEQRHLFAGTWTCVGRVHDVSGRQAGAPVRQRSVVVGDVPVLLTFTDTDTDTGEGTETAPRAFANTCRHRGHELLARDQSTTTRSIVCPYHGWNYRLDGSLRVAPEFRHAPGFQAEEHHLVELPVAVWHGWLFVHAERGIEEGPVTSFAEHVGGLDEVVAPYSPASLVLGDRHTYTVNANWKVLTENYHECYHCPQIHPELCKVTPPASGENYDLPGAWVGGSMDLREGMATMSVTGETSGPALPGVGPGRVEYVGLFPNLLISPHPDYVMTHRLVPQAPDRTWVECSWYFLPSNPPVDPAYAVEFWDLTNQQDWSACESVQRGLASPHFQPGPLSPSEDAVHQFVTMVGHGYRGQPLG
ncbi:MAG TPA: aromatic ring-hydroxylating dioxygenase subunit alpha [Nocardioidaceae bacterium]|nr:aromatic ring-hydroxylating dioxygenase subunit alpha [Nocardioidaceae bacterium]